MGGLSRLGRSISVRPGEGRALLLAFGYFFFVLATYYVLRPVRDEMGVRSGVRNLPWLFTGTFLVSLAIAPLYAGLVARLERRRFIPLIYGFLTLNILAFWALLSGNVATGGNAMVRPQRGRPERPTAGPMATIGWRARIAPLMIQ